MPAMKPGEAKTVFAYLMKVSRKRKLTDYEIGKLTEARQTLRRQARPAMNKTRKQKYRVILKATGSRALLSGARIIDDVFNSKEELEAWLYPYIEEMRAQGYHPGMYELKVSPVSKSNPKDYAQYGGKHYLQHRKESITTGTPVMHRKEKDFGRVQRMLASGDLIVKWDDGETSQVTQSAVKAILETPKSHRLPNPGIKIYGRCLRIEAIKMVEHLYNGHKARATQRYFHDFTSKNAIIYGLPDGSLLIKSR